MWREKYEKSLASLQKRGLRGRKRDGKGTGVNDSTSLSKTIETGEREDVSPRAPPPPLRKMTTHPETSGRTDNGEDVVETHFYKRPEGHDRVCVKRAPLVWDDIRESLETDVKPYRDWCVTAEENQHTEGTTII